MRESRDRTPRFGGYGGGETPGPIPNPEVKPSSADGTARVTGWESRSLPEHRANGPPPGAARSVSTSLEPPPSGRTHAEVVEATCRCAPERDAAQARRAAARG